MRYALAVLFAASAFAAKTLDIYFIDTEGGKAELIVAPSGQSLLIDTGYANFSGRDADRIAAAAKTAHVKHIDAVLITHHHGDHEGGVANLLQRLTAGAFYDHGPSADTSAEQQKTFKAYESALANQHREVIKPGDTIPIKGLEVTVMVAGGAHIDRKGEANPYCSGVAPQANDIAENAQSAGVLIQYGKFRFADFGDLTWNKEIELLCPENRVGKLDVFVSDHHGGETAPVIHALAPRVVVMNNGARKGGDPRGWKTLKESPGLEDLWQLHFAMAGGQGANSSDTVIANVEEHCEGKYLKLSAESSGAFTILNSRNKYTKTYAAK